MPGLPTDTTVAVSAAEYLWFADLALGTMASVVEELGDELANRRPDLPRANTPYAILTHCLGVMEYWGGATVAGRTIERDRAAEFVAAGPVAPLVGRVAEARRRLRQDLGDLDSAEQPAQVYRNPDHPVPYTETKGAVLQHVLEELFQHLGQMELTRDILVAEASAVGPVPMACALDVEGLAERLTEWRAFVASPGIVGMESEPTEVRLVLDGTDAALAAAVSLGQREKQCCPFFDVTVVLDGQGAALRLSVPRGAEEALASFVVAVTP
jgi:DinB superfamily